jgi:succinate dehydrogenase/fumarate reductase flavoprotein subunit
VRRFACDVLVAGSGIGGMSAAVTAARAGAEVVVVEKDRRIGGNAKWAGGFDIESDTYEGMRAGNPEGDPDLQQALVDDFPVALDWLRSLGVELVPDPDAPGRYNYFPHQGLGGIRLFSVLRRQLEAHDGRLLLGTGLRSLRTDDSGAVVGAVCRSEDTPVEAEAPATVLATGSFSRNTDMRVRYFGVYGDRGSYYGSRHHDGDGILAALDVGASVSSGISVSTGGCVFAPPFDPPDDRREFLGGGSGLTPEQRRMPEPVPSGVQRLSLRPPIWGDEPSILVNLGGDRFVDESSRYTVIGWATGRQREGVGFCIFDRPVYEEFAETIEVARGLGARILSAETAEDLAFGLAGWRRTPSYNEGVNPRRLLRTLAEYNASARGRKLEDLWPPRREGGRAIDHPPFYAAPVVQGVVDPAGGLRIDADARVLDRGGRPIRGLFAAGADAGRAYTREHGGLAFGLIFGRRAGASAFVVSC